MTTTNYIVSPNGTFHPDWLYVRYPEFAGGKGAQCGEDLIGVVDKSCGDYPVNPHRAAILPASIQFKGRWDR